MSFANRPIIIFGSTGQIGSAVARLISERFPGRLIHKLRWQDIRSAGVDQVLAKLRAESPSFDHVVANGLTQASLPEKELRRSNFEFVVQLHQGSRPADRFLTFGTIHEDFPNLREQNAYFQSKWELGRWMQQQAAAPGGQGRFLHLRLHTLYGGRPKPHMFLGLMLQALQDNRPFKMSSGDQLREYHHVEDLASAVGKLLSRDWLDLPASIEISSDRALRLADLARAIFKTFGKEELLSVGSIARAGAENVERRFERSPDWLLGSDREPIAGVVQTLKTYLDRKS